jgi:hypothetical protein
MAILTIELTGFHVVQRSEKCVPGDSIATAP